MPYIKDIFYFWAFAIPFLLVLRLIFQSAVEYHYKRKRRALFVIQESCFLEQELIGYETRSISDRATRYDHIDHNLIGGELESRGWTVRHLKEHRLSA